MKNFDFGKTVKTPCYITDREKLEKNLEVLKEVQSKMNCKILLAQKAFSQFSEYKLISELCWVQIRVDYTKLAYRMKKWGLKIMFFPCLFRK